MRIPSDRLATKALLALEEAAKAAEHAPGTGNLSTRFALAYLFAVGTGSKEPYDLFWQALRRGTDAYGDCVQRFAMACAALEGIYRDVGRQRTRQMIFYDVERNHTSEGQHANHLENN